MLTEILREILRQAMLNRGERKAANLKHGLSIHVYVDETNQLHLLLTRKDSPPSDSEWSTVIRNFPSDWPMPQIPPVARRFKEGQKHCMAAVWPIPRLDPFSANTPEPTAEEQPA